MTTQTTPNSHGAFVAKKSGNKPTATAAKLRTQREENHSGLADEEGRCSRLGRIPELPVPRPSLGEIRELLPRDRGHDSSRFGRNRSSMGGCARAAGASATSATARMMTLRVMKASVLLASESGDVLRRRHGAVRVVPASSRSAQKRLWIGLRHGGASH